MRCLSTIWTSCSPSSVNCKFFSGRRVSKAKALAPESGDGLVPPRRIRQQGGNDVGVDTGGSVIADARLTLLRRADDPDRVGHLVGERAGRGVAVTGLPAGEDSLGILGI